MATVRNGNLLVNSDFEQGETEWRFGQSSAADFQIVTDEVHDGSNAVRAIADGDGSSVQYNRTINLEPNTQYTLSGWIKTQDISGGGWAAGGVCLRLYGTSIPDFTVHEGGSKNGDYIFTDHLGGTNDWTYVHVAFTTAEDPPGGLTLTVCADGSSGTAWYDGIALLPSGPNASPTVSDTRLRARGFKGSTTGLFWIQNSEHTWYNVVLEGQTPSVVQGAALTVPNMASGDYTVEWWDTYAGVVTGTASASTDGSGNLTVVLPAVQKDIACKIRPSGSGGEDTTPPTTPVISTAEQVVDADTFAVELSAASTDANFSNYQLMGGQYASWTDTVETGPSFTFTLVQNTANTLSIRGRDASGNVSAAASVVITEDSPPSVPAQPVHIE
jgi:hypothetical protein